MAAIQTSFQPERIAADVFIARGAVIVGAVTIAARSSVWFNAVLRGDTELLDIGAGVNIQDGAVCHADAGYPLIVGAGVTVGHRAILHGASIGEHSLIGMGAIVMNGAQIGRHSIVGAGALVTQGKAFPESSLILGAPARAVRQVTSDEIAMIRRSAAEYEQKARAFQDCCRRSSSSSP